MSADTRRLVVDTAIQLFREQGYEKTTMRAIAQKAGLSVGNAYYYFPSKDHLVQEFYAQIQQAQAEACAEALREPGPLGARLHAALTACVDVMAPYHSFAGGFISTAATPNSPVSPFSPESAPARERSLAIFRDVVAGSTTKLDAALRADLPELLWLCQMGMTLYWVHDTSPDQARTRMFIDRAVPFIEHLISLTRLRVFRGVTAEALALYHALRPS